MDHSPLLETLPIPLLGVNQREEIVLWNREMERLAGWGAGEVMGVPCCQVLRCRDSSGKSLCAGYCRNHRRVVEGGLPGEGTVMQIATKSGTYCPLQERTSLVTDASNGTLLFHAFSPARSPLFSFFSRLTPREKEILALLSQGKSNQEIASRLVIQESTVKTHINNLFRKLKVRDRVELLLKLTRPTGIGLPPGILSDRGLAGTPPSAPLDHEPRADGRADGR